jgi:hypothetical protein
MRDRALRDESVAKEVHQRLPEPRHISTSGKSRIFPSDQRGRLEDLVQGAEVARQRDERVEYFTSISLRT